MLYKKTESHKAYKCTVWRKCVAFFWGGGVKICDAHSKHWALERAGYRRLSTGVFLLHFSAKMRLFSSLIRLAVLHFSPHTSVGLLYLQMFCYVSASDCPNSNPLSRKLVFIYKVHSSAWVAIRPV